MDSPSWSDAVTAALGSCLPCFHSNDSDNENSNSSSRSRPPQHLEALLADPHDTDTDAETVSLYSNLGSGNPRTRKKKKRNGQGITLFGLNLFGKPTQPIHLPEDEEEVDRLLNRSSDRRTLTSTSSSRVTRSSSLTFDSDAASLDPAALDRLTPAQLEERARQVELQAEEERRAKEERRRLRREKKEMKRLAAQLAVGAGGEEGFEGFQGSGGDLPPHIPVASHNGYPFIPPPLLSAEALGSPVYEDEADGAADLDGTLYTGRTRAGSASGGGSDSQRSPASGSVVSYADATNLTPSTEPRKKKKKSSSGKSKSSKSSKSRSSATSSTQSPSLASPVGSEFTGIPSFSDGFSRPKPTLNMMSDSFSVEDRGFPSPGLGGLARSGRNGAFLASRGDDI